MHSDIRIAGIPERRHGGSRTGRGRRSRLVAAACLAVALMLLSVSAARAELTSDLFTPSAGISASSDQAGAHPDLALRMVKKPNKCLVVTGANGSCYIFKPAPQWIKKVEPYIEQDLKKWVVTFPEGLMADPQATPKCDDPQRVLQPDDPQYWQYLCPPESQVGVLTGKTRNCKPGNCPKNDSLPIAGAIYNGTPEPGEQGHLYTLVGPVNNNGVAPPWVRIDTSVKVTQPGFRIEATTDMIPDHFQYPGLGGMGGPKIPIQPYDITMTLWGDVGAKSGHPLLTNATFCNTRSLDSVFQGYAGYAYVDDDGVTIHTGSGTGKTVTNSAPYAATGCDAVPYEPRFSMSLSSSAVGAAPTIDTAIEQADGEQTTKRVSVRIPGAFRMNSLTKVVPCPPDQLAADACPDSSRVGSGVARSRLLPSDALAGSVNMGAADGGAFPLRASLKGFVDVTIDGSVSIDTNGDLVTTFDNLPPVPISSFAMRLDGGAERGLLINPARCGDTSAVTATFTSHQGREVSRSVPLHISCGSVTFGVKLGKLRRGKPPHLTLTTRATGLDRLAYRLPPKLARPAPRLRAGRALGTLNLKLTKGSRQAKVVIASRTAKRLNLAATSGGAKIADLSLSQPKPAKPARKSRRGKRTKKTHRRQSRAIKLVFEQLPADTVAVELELGGGKSGLFRSPATCPKSLKFAMDATDPDGARHAATRKVKTKCVKHKPKRRNRKSKGRHRM